MELVQNLLQQMLNAVAGFFMWLFGFLGMIFGAVTRYIPQQFIFGGLVILLMILILLRVGLKSK